MKETFEKKMKTSAQVIANLDKQIVQLLQQLQQQQNDQPEAGESCRLRWLEGPRAPCEMKSSFNAMVDNNNNSVYL